MEMFFELFKIVMPIIVIIISAFLAYRKYLIERAVERKENTTLFIDSIRGEIKGIREQVKLIRLTVSNALDGENNLSRDLLTKEIEKLLSLIERPFFDSKVQDIGLLNFGLSRHVLQLYADLSALKLQSTRLSFATDEGFRLELVHLNYDVRRWVAEATELNCIIELWATEKQSVPWKIMRERGEYYRRLEGTPPVDFDAANKQYLKFLQNKHPKAHKAIRKLYMDITE